MTPLDILNEMIAEVSRPKKPRTFAGGLLPAFCDFFLDLDTAAGHFTTFDEFLAVHPLVVEGANTLSVLPNGVGKKKTIRPAYNAIERFYLFENRRLDYPSMAPHATGQWKDYQRWLESMVTFTREDLIDLREKAKGFILSFLKESKFDPSSVVVRPPIFRMLIEQFPWSDRRGQEKTGAAFQAMVFAFIRADSPHLQVEVRKVRTGSARVKGIGDIDAWEGKALTISAEVKHFQFGLGGIEALGQFVHKVRERGALGMVVATGFAEGARQEVLDTGLVPVSVDDLIKTVSLWDPVKQQAALNAFEWAVVQKEQTTGLIERYEEFLVGVGYRQPAASVAPSASPAIEDEVELGEDLDSAA